jgi:hypothetical protein
MQSTKIIAARQHGALAGRAGCEGERGLPQTHRDLGRAVAREQHVGGLEVEVDDALVVQVVQPARDLQRDAPAPGTPAMGRVTAKG